MPSNHHPGHSTGRTVKARHLQYLHRPADDGLFVLCRENHSAFILTSPQMGKSSMIAQTADRLVKEQIHPIIIDLSQFPIPPREEDWFDKILMLLEEELDLSTDAVAWWEGHRFVPPPDRLLQVFENVILPETTQPLVLFLDEIERTLLLSFRSQMFAWLGALDHARHTNPKFHRVSVVVCGVATPTQLLLEGSSQLFRLSQPITLTDFTLSEVLPLAAGLSLPLDTAEEVVQWVYQWTQGHPYLTQLFCQVIEEQHRSQWTQHEVDDCIRHYLVSPQGVQDRNLQFVRTALTEPGMTGLSLLNSYLALWEGTLDPQTTDPAILDQLRLSGIIREENGTLTIRNAIYKEVFPASWARRYLPAVSTRLPNAVPSSPEAPTTESAQKDGYSLSRPAMVAAALLLVGVGFLLSFLRPAQNTLPAPSDPLPSLAISSGPPPSINPQATKELEEAKRKIQELETALGGYQNLSDQKTETLTEERNTFETQLASKQQELSEAQAQIQQLEATLVRYQQLSDQEATRLAKERKTFENQVASQKQDLSEAQTHIHDLENTLAKRRSLQNQDLARLQAERDTLSNKLKTTGGKLQTVREELQDLQMVMLKQSPLPPAEIKKLTADRSRLETQLKIAHQELALTQEQNRELESRLTQQQQVVQTETQRLTGERNRLEAKINGLETALNDTQNRLKTTETSAKERVQLAQSKLNRLQQDRENLQEQLTERQQELAMLKTQTAELKQTLSQQTDQLLKDKGERATLTSELHDVRSRESKTQTRLTQLEGLLAQQQKETLSSITVLQQERDRLSSQLEQAQRDLNSTQTQVATLGDQLAAAKNQVAQTQQAQTAIHASSTEQIRRSEERLTELALIQATLETRLHDSQASLTKAQERIRQLESQAVKASDIEEQLQHTEKERETLSSTLQKTQQQLTSAQQKLVRIEKSVEKAMSTSPIDSFNSFSLDPQPTAPIAALTAHIASELDHSEESFESTASRLLWARQAFLFSQRSGGTEWASIDQTLRNGLHTAPIQLKSSSARIHTLAFHPLGGKLVGGTNDGHILLWLLNTPRDTPQKLSGHSAGVLSVAFSPDGGKLASSSLDSTIRLWNLSQPNAPAKVLEAHNKGVTSIAFHPDGRHLASGSQDHTVRLWTLNESTPSHTLIGSHDGWVNAVTFTPDGHYLLTAGDDLTLRIWDLRRPTAQPKILRGHSQSVSSITVHPSGWVVGTGSRDRQIGLWNLRESIVSPRFLQGSTGRISQVQFTTDGTKLAAVSSDKVLRLWNWQAPSDHPVEFSDHVGNLEALAISPDGQTIAVGGAGRTVTIWGATEQLAQVVCDTAKQNLSFDEWKNVLGKQAPYERTCPNLPIHPSFLEEGIRLAKQGARDQAQSIFERAKQLDPYLELDPKKEVEKLSAQSS